MQFGIFILFSSWSAVRSSGTPSTGEELAAYSDRCSVMIGMRNRVFFPRPHSGALCCLQGRHPQVGDH